MSELLKKLNPAQQEICKWINGPVLILAGAGSGKTRVLTHRIAHLILDHQIYPKSILAVTFTNKAAKEMKKRVESILNQSVDGLWIGTFHSLFARILRIEAKNIGYDSNFTIYDSQDSVNVVKGILTDHEINLKEHYPKQVYYHFSSLKDQLIEPTPIKYSVHLTKDELYDYVYYKYEEVLAKNNAFDFNDLIIKPIQLFQKVPEILDKYQNLFKYVLVDEYQDTNKAQYTLVKMLSDKHQNLTVVGDEDQSIYKWRGADISNILNFESDFKQAKIFRLEQNYRSTGTILDAANLVVRNNRNRLGKSLWTEQESGAKIVLMETDSDSDEAFQVIKHLSQEIKDLNLTYKDAVVLYRTNAQSRRLEDILRKRGMAYTIVGGHKFYDRKEIKDLIAYMRIIVNPADSLSIQRIINIPARGIGGTTIMKLVRYADEQGISVFDALKQANRISSINTGTQKKLYQFYDMMQKHIDLREDMNAFELATSIIEESGILNFYRMDPAPESESRVENIHELMNSISEFTQQNPQENKLELFLQEVQLITDVDEWNQTDDKITLMTLHSAKGLEFPLVFIVGLEEGLFPHENSIMNNDDLEEERRLFYVGITRAEKKLYLSWAKQRMRGYGNFNAAVKSSFITEIPADLMEIKNFQSGYSRSYERTGYVNFEKSYDEFDQSLQLRIGMIVEHDEFGKGKILNISGRDDMAKVTVQFANQQTKKLIAKYANLQPVDYFD